MLDLSYNQILELGNQAFTKTNLPPSKGLFMRVDWLIVSVTFFFPHGLKSISVRSSTDLEEFKKELQNQIKNR
jgi:hypothetical protein